MLVCLKTKKINYHKTNLLDIFIAKSKYYDNKIQLRNDQIIIASSRKSFSFNTNIIKAFGKQ